MFERARLTVTSHLEELSTVQQWFHAIVTHVSDKYPWLNEQFDQLNLAIAEGFTNAVRHAHAKLPESTPIDIELSLESNRIEICIFDQGGPFDPSSLSEPQPGALREGGYGWFLLRRLADKVTYNRANSIYSTPLPTVGLTEKSNSEPTLFSEQASGQTNTEQTDTEQAQQGQAQQQNHPRNCLRIVKTSKIV